MHRRVLDYLASARLVFVRGFRHRTPAWCARHSHPAFEIVYHARGSGVMTDDAGVRLAFDEGDVVICGPGVAHDQAVRGGGDDVCVQVAADPVPPTELATSMLVRAPDAATRRELLELCVVPSDLPPARKLALDHRAAAALIHLLEVATAGERGGAATAAERYAAAAHDYVRENPTTIESMEDVAEAVGIGYDHLRHAFRRRYGKSMKRWHLEVRVGRARDLLAHTTVPLKQIARLCGFSTERYFSACFRKLAGTTPGRYRRANESQGGEPRRRRRRARPP
jgi:AraC-like DNA-binding protein